MGGWKRSLDGLGSTITLKPPRVSIFSIKYTIPVSRQGSPLSFPLDLLPVPASVSRHRVSSQGSGETHWRPFRS